MMDEEQQKKEAQGQEGAQNTVAPQENAPATETAGAPQDTVDAQQPQQMQQAPTPQAQAPELPEKSDVETAAETEASQPQENKEQTAEEANK